MCSMTALATAAAPCPPGSGIKVRYAVVRSTMVATAELDTFDPMIRSPSWWPGTSSALGFGGTLPDRDRADDAAAGLPAAAAVPDGPAGAQAGAQLTPQGTAGVDIQRLVDRLGTDPHGRVVWIEHFQPPGGLLG